MFFCCCCSTLILIWRGKKNLIPPEHRFGSYRLHFRDWTYCVLNNNTLSQVVIIHYDLWSSSQMCLNERFTVLCDYSLVAVYWCDNFGITYQCLCPSALTSFELPADRESESVIVLLWRQGGFIGISHLRYWGCNLDAKSNWVSYSPSLYTMCFFFQKQVQLTPSLSLPQVWLH